MKIQTNKIKLTLNSDDQIYVKGVIDPIKYSNSNCHVNWKELAKLRVAESEKQYDASVLHAFLPKQSISVGESWMIEEKSVHTLLTQLHSKPNLDLHINIGDSNGAWACLRAYNDEYADIVFRIHAEFAFEDGWFTPSQFSGHLIINRTKNCVEFFQMSVPEGTLFDVNWKKHKDEPGFSDDPYYSTDGGLCPKIELRTESEILSTDFTTHINQEAAERKLIQQFYKSHHINWVSWDKALETAQAQQKPIHAISIDGPLSDEAC